MFKLICSVQKSHCLETTFFFNVFAKHNTDLGNGSMLMKPLLSVPWFPSSCSCPALRAHYHHRELMCSVLLNSQHNMLNTKLCEQLMAELINPPFQLFQCLRCKHNPTVPQSLLWQRMLSINTTITSKPPPAPWRSFFPKTCSCFSVSCQGFCTSSNLAYF